MARLCLHSLLSPRLISGSATTVGRFLLQRGSVLELLIKQQAAALRRGTHLWASALALARAPQRSATLQLPSSFATPQAHGRLASTVYWPADHPARKHDVLFSWVNGSDWEHARALDLYAQPGVGRVEEWWAEDQRQSKSPRASKRDKDEHRTSKKGIHLRDVGENRFREIDELRYAVRSAATNLQDLGTIQVLSPSFFPPRPFDIAAAQPPKHAAPVDWEAPRKKHSTFLTEDGRVQWGQVPGWVNLSHPEVKTGAITSPLGGEHLRFQHDWQVWTPNWLNPASTLNPSSGSISGHVLAAWKQEHLPTFNSIAFESMLGAPVTPSSRETFVYANDDMFFTSPLTLSDFTTPLFGPVLRFDPTLLVRGHRYFDESSSGEWPSLSHSAWLLDRRFGTRVRPYTVHDPRTFDTRVLKEMRMMWAAEWRATGEDRFRSERLDRPGTSTHFMMAHYFVERFREAALWSYLVLRLDKNDDGFIDASEMTDLLISLRLPLPGKSLNEIITSGSGRYTGSVLLPHRSLFEQNAHLSHLSSLSLPHPRRTSYKFVAQDGAYPFMTLHPYVQSKAPPRPAGGGQASGVHQVGEEPYPRYHAREGKTPKTDTRYGKTACRLDIAACLSGLVRDDGRMLAQDLFKRIAFEKGEKCGDCLLVHLLGQSGQRGLNAFLPPQGKVFPPSETAPRPQEEPHLPLTPTYFSLNKSQELSEDPAFIFSPYEEDNKPDFSSASVSSSLGWAQKSQRDFALRLLQRYSYVIGSSPSRFHRMEFEASTAAFLDDLSIELGTGAIGDTNLDAELVDESEVPAFVCLNDDYGSTSKGRMRALFEGWARKTFPARPAWEEDGGKQM
ncbi:hypothetical protein BDZ90DRAFT_272208 [Jaminaea rosea]|uniref:EF-hand domain-containing protein n=1 Tax=Jaminaea rosea TaxID=1569628 RepID=A0A316UQC5_9BASI|nr:hypothetical protein BDZ90DRAFT_272208 [Jaminaea rosea]PWN27174.1 hypothetical protein BDZ90DRAFT_272208 [Jaminaea rosea]